MAFDTKIQQISEFRSGRAPILVATDVAARGLGKCGPVMDCNLIGDIWEG